MARAEVSTATPIPLQPEYGLLWWLYRWGEDDLLVARGSEGHLIVVVPSQGVVIAISSANMQEVPMDDYVLFPLLADLIIRHCVDDPTAD